MFGQNYGFSDNSFNQPFHNSGVQTNQFTHQQQHQSNMYNANPNQFIMGQENSPMNNNMNNQQGSFNMAFQNMHVSPTNPQLQTHGLQGQSVQMNISPMLAQNEVENQSQTSQLYTSYENLPNYGQDCDLNQVVASLKGLFEDKAQWKSKFDAIDNLRILNKYYVKKMNEIIDMFWAFIIESFESQKSCIVKNILMFSTEVFMNASQVRIQDEIIIHLVPQVLIKCISEKSVIKKEAENSLGYLTLNCYFYDSSIVTLAKCCCFDKNPTVSEIALNTLAKVIYQIGDSLPMLKFESLQALIYTLGKIMDSAKKGNMKKWATNLCINLYKRFGAENYKQLVMSTIGNQNPELVPYLAKAIEDKKDSKSRESHIHEIKQDKMNKAMMNQVQNQNQNQFGMMNNMQKMNPQTLLGQPLQGKQAQGLNYQVGSNMMPMQGFYQNENNGYNNGGLFGGQVGLNFPQNY